MEFSVVRAGFASALVVSSLGVSGCNDNGIAAMPGNLTASPAVIDYGLVKEQTELAQTVVLSNRGNSPVDVRGLRFDPPDAPFRFTGGLPSAAEPWRLAAGDYKAVEIAFAPTVNGAVDGDLIVTSTDPDGGGELRVGVLGHGFHTALDDYQQGGTIGGKADILFVVDNSGSMGEEQTKLGNSFSTFINWLAGGAVDYHIAVTTTDMDDPNHQGRFQGNPKVIGTTTPNVTAAFQANANVGTAGSGSEKGLQAAASALSPALLSGPNAGFLRGDAKLYVVWVTDEEDSSSGTPASFQAQITSAKGGDPTQVFFAAITGPKPFGCFNLSGSADAGTRYLDIVDATGGLFGSICDADFGVTLQNLAFQVTSAGGLFPLSEIPDPSTIQVLVYGIPQATTTWTYLPQPNAVQFVPGYEPTAGAAVTITYDVL